MAFLGGDQVRRVSGEYGYVEVGNTYAKASYNIPGHGEGHFTIGEKPAVPRWASALGNFFKKAGLVLAGVVCGALAIGLLPFTIAGFVLGLKASNIRERGGFGASERAEKYQIAALVLAAPFMGALLAFGTVAGKDFSK